MTRPNVEASGTWKIQEHKVNKNEADPTKEIIMS